MRPDLSIIVPVYNVERYIERCMNSLLKQSLKNVEIVLVDDGSTDNSSDLCDYYASIDNRVKVIHKNNEGLGMARNTGLDIASGKFVAFLDSDDYISDTMYEKMLNKLSITDADICICGYIDQKDNGSQIIHENPCGDNIYSEESKINEILLGMLSSSPTYKSDTYIGMSVWKCIYSNEIIQKNKIRFYSEREYISEDIMFQFSYMPFVKKVVTVKEGLYHYCENKNYNSLTKAFDKNKFIRYKDLYLKELNILKERGLYEKGRYYAARMFLGNTRAYLKLLVMNNSLSEKDKKLEIKNVCKNDIIKDILAWYPWIKNPIKQRIFSILIKFNLVTLIYWIILYSIKDEVN